jgi:hypothetical protein
LIAHEYEAGLLRFDGRFALSFKRGIQQRKRPARRGRRGDDPVVATVEMKIFRLVADLTDARQARANVKIDMRQMAMLGVAGTNTDCGRISVFNVPGLASRIGLSSVGRLPVNQTMYW